MLTFSRGLLQPQSPRKNLVCREKPSQTSHFLSSVVVAGGEAASWLRAHLSLSHTLLHTFYFLPLSLSFWILSPPLPLCFSSLCVFLSHTLSLCLSALGRLPAVSSLIHPVSYSPSSSSASRGLAVRTAPATHRLLYVCAALALKSFSPLLAPSVSMGSSTETHE